MLAKKSLSEKQSKNKCNHFPLAIITFACSGQHNLRELPGFQKHTNAPPADPCCIWTQHEFVSRLQPMILAVYMLIRYGQSQHRVLCL